MGWFRSNRRMGGGLALIALLIHFALTFGHLHVATSGNAVAALTSSEPTGTSGVPAHPLSHPGLADSCAICANIHLAASLLVEWPAWLLPLRAEEELPDSIGPTNRPAWLGTAVKARAPPIA